MKKTCASCEYSKGGFCYAEPPKITSLEHDVHGIRYHQADPTIKPDRIACRFWEPRDESEAQK